MPRCGIGHALGQRPIGLLASRRRSDSESAAAAGSVRATTITPDVSRSRRCTSRGRWRLLPWRPSSMPSIWRATPEPPWLGMPLGLFSTKVDASSWMTRLSMNALSAPPSVLAGRASTTAGVMLLIWGGSRIACPASSRSLALRALAVDAHLARAQQLLQMPVRERGIVALEPAVQAQARLRPFDFGGRAHAKDANQPEAGEERSHRQHDRAHHVRARRPPTRRVRSAARNRARTPRTW